MNLHKMDCRSEEWRPIAGFDGFEVSSFGRVRRKKQFGYVLLDIHTNKKNPYVSLSGSKRNVSSLVIKTFDEPRSIGEWVIGYKDGNTQNVRADNLYWKQKGSALACGEVGKGAIDDESVLLLWEAVLDLAIRDLWYGLRPRSGMDRLHADDAKVFFQKAYWFYIGEDPDPSTQRAIARRVKEYNDNRGRTQEKVSEVQVSLVGSGHEAPIDKHFGRPHFLRVLHYDWQEETLFS